MPERLRQTSKRSDFIGVASFATLQLHVVMPKAGKDRNAYRYEVAKASAPYPSERPPSIEKSSGPDSKDGSKSSRKRRKTIGQDVTESSSSKAVNVNNGADVLIQSAESATKPVGKEDRVPASTMETSTPPASGPDTISEKDTKDKEGRKGKKRSDKSTSSDSKKRKVKHELRELQARFQEAQAAAEAAQADLRKKIAELEGTVTEQAKQLKIKSTTLEETNTVCALLLVLN